MLTRKRPWSWDMQSKPPAGGLDGEDKHPHHPGTDWARLKIVWEKTGVSCFERIYTGCEGDRKR